MGYEICNGRELSNELIYVFRSASPSNVVSTKAPVFKSSGMKLGKKTKQSDAIDALGAEVATPNSIPNTPARAASPDRPKFTPNVTQERYSGQSYSSIGALD